MLSNFLNYKFKKYIKISIIFIGCITSIIYFTKTRSVSANGEAAAGVIVTIGLALFSEVKTAIQSLGHAAVYVKAKTDGPDSDDRAVNFESDEDLGFDWNLDADTGLVTGVNNIDDNQENPYTPGDNHYANIELHWDSTGGQWVPDPDGEFDGWVSSSPEDDPVKKNEETFAAAAGAFSADGKTVDFCYSAESINDLYEEVKKVPCSPIPELEVEEGIIFLASTEQFDFEESTNNQILIKPLFSPTIDLFHFYLQRNENLSILPVINGYHESIQEVKNDIYQEMIAGTNWTLSNSPSELADLTIVGAAIHFDNLLVSKDGKTKEELLAEYFSSNAITIISPTHAQQGYEPQVILRQQIKSGQDITNIVGRNFTIPFGERNLVGLILGVKGNIDNAVALAVNTDGHFVRTIANEARDKISQIANEAQNNISQKVEFKIPGMNYHYENSSALLDIATASPSPNLVNLAKFKAHTQKNKIHLTWLTGTETQNVSFRLWRAIKDQYTDYKPILLGEFGHSEQVNPEPNENCSTKIQGQLKANNFNQPPQLISAIGNSAENTCYSFTDTSNLNDGTYYYLLEDISDDGKSTFHCDQIDAVTIGQGLAIDLESAINYCKEVTGSNN